MKKLAFSLICANAFASNFVGLDIYGSWIAEENGLSYKDDFLGRADLYVNKFYTNEENPFVYDIRFTHAKFESDVIASNTVIGNEKHSFNSFSALGGYGMLVGNDVSLSFLGGLGYAKLSEEYKFSNALLKNMNVKASDNSMFLKTGVAARKQFENNFTMSGGVYLKYYFDKILEKDLNAEFDISLGYTFSNNIYAGVRFGYVNDISKGGSAGIGLSYKF